MFCISYFERGEIKKDLKIIINFIKNDGTYINTVEIQANLKNACLISDVISNNIRVKDSYSIYKYDIVLDKYETFNEDEFIKLLVSTFNNDRIIFSEENHQILQIISKEFEIVKLASSINRYISYLDQLHQFIHGRLPLIDSEFLCQLYLLDLNEENIEDTENASYRFIDEITEESYCQILYRCIYSRMSKSTFYLEFITQKLKDFIKPFIRTLIRNYRFCSFSNSNQDYDLPVICYLLRYFIENNYLSRADEESFNYQCGWRSYTYQFFDFDDGNIHYDSRYYVFRHYDELTKDNYALHRKLVLNGKNQDPLFQIIERDDLESLEKLIVLDQSFDINTMIDKCYYESRPPFESKSFNLIEIAAFFGSIKIFKYLIINNAIIRREELLLMAFYGGNPEIIRICQQKDIEYGMGFKNFYETPITISIKMNYFDLLRWLFGTLDQDNYSRDIDKLIGYSLRCSNYLAFYYLIQKKLNIENDSEEEEELIEYSTDFTNYANDLILSYNIPVLKNYLNIKNKNLKLMSTDLNKNFLNILLINDTNLIDIFLKDNFIDDFDDIPYENISSLTYQQMGRYFIKHKNVNFTSEFLSQLIEDLLNDDLKNDESQFKTDNVNNIAIHNKIKSPEFIKEQIELIFNNALVLEDVILLLPAIFKYNLYENNYMSKYKPILNSNYNEFIFYLIGKNRKIFTGFIKYTNLEVIEFVLKRMNKGDKRKFKSSDYILDNSFYNNLEIFQYLITSEFSPFSEDYKFDQESFFSIFYRITSIETLKKVIQIFSKNSKFYSEEFLPNVLYNSCDSCEEIIRYLLSLPEIKPFINKENEKYKNLPPLLYNCTFVFDSIDCFKPFFDNDDVDINIRDSEKHKNILAFTSNRELLMLALSNKRFVYTPEDVTLCIENDRYPGVTETFEFFLNGILYDDDDKDHKNPLNLKIEFSNEQLSRIFNKICITDDRVDLAKLFYSKFSDRIDVNYEKDESENFCLLDAIDCDSDKMVNFLLSIPDIDLNRRASTGSINSHFDYTDDITPFCFAVVCGRDEIINQFFKRSSDFDVNETFSQNIFFIIFL